MEYEEKGDGLRANDQEQSTVDKHTSSTPSSISAMSKVVEPDDEPKYLTGFQLIATMVSITVVGFLFLLDVSVVSTAVPKITSEFHSLNDVGWYGTAYLIASSALQPLTGKMYSMFSNKWTFITFFAIFEFGSLICGVAVSSNMLIIGRAIAGLGSSGLLNGAYTIIYASVAPERQAALNGILIAFAQLGVVGGPLIGGAFTQHASWRWCFYINLPLGAIVGAVLPFISLPDHSGKSHEKRTVLQSISELDLLGFALFAASAVELLLALNWGGSTFAWNSSQIIGLFCGSGVTLIAFLGWQYRQGEHAMIPLSIIGRRIVLASCTNYLLFAGCMLVSTYYLPIYFQSVRGASPTSSGVDLLPTIIASIVFSGVTGGFAGRLGYYIPFGVASGVFLAVGSGLLATLKPSTSTASWIGYQILQGVGRGLGFQIPVLAVQNNWITKSEVPILTGLVVFSQQLGGAIFLSIAQVVFETSLRSDLVADAPGVDPETVIKAGAAGVRGSVTAAALPGVLVSYSHAINRAMYVATGCAAGAFLFAFAMGWTNIKKGKAGVKVADDTETAGSG